VAGQVSSGGDASAVGSDVEASGVVAVGDGVGSGLGSSVAVSVGVGVGSSDGVSVGMGVGDSVGVSVGDGLGDGLGAPFETVTATAEPARTRVPAAGLWSSTVSAGDDDSTRVT
jgi:hypothetical protein